jgi:hypothetical protein
VFIRPPHPTPIDIPRAPASLRTRPFLPRASSLTSYPSACSKAPPSTTQRSSSAPRSASSTTRRPRAQDVAAASVGRRRSRPRRRVSPCTVFRRFCVNVTVIWCTIYPPCVMSASTMHSESASRTSVPLGISSCIAVTACVQNRARCRVRRHLTALADPRIAAQ